MKKKILFNFIDIQHKLYAGISKDTFNILRMCYENADCESYILVSKKSHTYIFITSIQFKPLRTILWAVYLVCNIFKIAIPHYRTPKPISTKSIPQNIQWIAKIVDNDYSRILEIDMSIVFLSSSLYMRLSPYVPWIHSLIKIETKKFDFFFIPYLLPFIIIDRNTKQLIRYHDSIPIKLPYHSNTTSFQYSLQQAININSIFICTTKPVEMEFMKYFPSYTNKTIVITHTRNILHPHCRIVDREKCNEIILKNVSLQCLEKNQIFHSEKIYSQFSTTSKYICNVASLAQNKNQIKLIQAWVMFREETKENIKLILIGGIGRKDDAPQIFNLMRHFVLSGDLLHIPSLSEKELSYLYSHAECYISPSLNEGFGMPPLEAMECGCPCIISDIPEHNWVYDDSALKINPTSIEDIKNKLKILLHNDDGKLHSEELIKKGYEQIKRYTKESISPQWKSFINNISQYE